MLQKDTSENHHHPLLRHRDGHHARVTFEELFFDLVYVFAVTQLSHELLHNLSLTGVIHTLILWFAVWLGWQYTCWVTNWFDPETPRIRGVLFVTMLLALVMASAIGGAFDKRGLVFALAYVAIQVGRTAYIVFELGRDHPLSANYRRMLGWLLIASCFWISGAFTEHWARATLWAIAVLCEYVSPMFGFALPGLGRSRTSDWTIEGGHLSERCQLFVIVALGETLLATGAMLAEAEVWSVPILSAMLATFAGTLAMWWLYFGTSSKDATATITHSSDPGRIGAYFHYIHAVLIAGVIVTAVGNDLVMAHPHEHGKLAYALILSAGPMIYLVGSAIYKQVVYGCVPASHIVGVVALAALIPIALQTDLLAAGWLTSAFMLAIGFWEASISRAQMQTRPAAH
ncbi:low temperature requirement protein A [Beijerinckia indica]|uniref:Low temperature requirement A n=1 Tax=Beijerinckia indica subsp. indica (strain ATCC 9039 / DSM 1715 / NCIMB 8712) TaxID=395963 RepID=B2IIN5_BEII9|nr:low temperature requirement protein A [Beijerinckia indica]ACB94728.1 low temperature requirement A [Beijerinckia indica subsp. indica ATCC 9039]